MIFGFFVPFSGIEWYFKLPLRLPLSPAEISLNDTEWYSMVISGIQLALFCQGTFNSMVNFAGEMKATL